MVSHEIYAAECYLTASFEPTLPLSLPFFLGEDRDEHPIAEEWSFFDEINNSKSFSGCFMAVVKPIKEPIIVTISIYIVFY